MSAVIGMVAAQLAAHYAAEAARLAQRPAPKMREFCEGCGAPHRVGKCDYCGRVAEFVFQVDVIYGGQIFRP